MTVTATQVLRRLAGRGAGCGEKEEGDGAGVKAFHDRTPLRTHAPFKTRG